MKVKAKAYNNNENDNTDKKANRSAMPENKKMGITLFINPTKNEVLTII
jgi:hypothetical protein